MVDKFTVLTPELHRYAVAHSSYREGAVPEIERAADEMGEMAVMQIAGDQAALLTLLVAATGARRALEVGSFLGYGALAIARGLPPDGRLVCCELDAGYAEAAHRHLELAGVGDRVEIRIGSALGTLAAMDEDGSYDFAFVDADKSEYPAYFEHCLRLVRPGALILIDNVFMGGRVLDPPEGDEGCAAVAGLNDALAGDERVDVAMLSMADGITIARKR